MENTSFIELAKTLISYSIRCPSGHNSQPWSFQVANNKIIIVPDLNKHLEVVDGNDKELFISLGCALENLQIAATHFGYSTEYFVSEDDKINVTFTKKESTTVNEENEVLFKAIDKRHTHRSKFLDKKLTDEQLQYIEKEKDDAILVYDSKSEGAKIICQKITEGNSIQMADPAFKDELVAWMRFNNKHREATQNGLCYNVLGFPPTPEFLGRRVIKMFLNPNAQNKTDKEVNASASHFCVFTIKDNTVKEYVALGKILEHFILKITSMGLSYSFSNQPCEVSEILGPLKEELKVSVIPAVIIRLGYGTEPKNFSPRETPEIQFLE
ncbi:hypothetical protein BCR32DRAFT_245314 [Anaeromyces robustus]|jgi:nitroreductase|uniref:Nitroreductase n=1 Tax=Anaeromyces robustus TaxID=1754192 RepID=A0A1Y1X4W3_9FUNG|nr:hypothetical protein BCR32DRAFT_245314 [Anaeromyces robustus]|eukprot:ORX80861.1 hypothetical protein BCR32DRAFT_245314 [Anaeromyces robustus]